MDIKEGWPLWFTSFLKWCDTSLTIPQNKKVADELHKPIIRKF